MAAHIPDETPAVPTVFQSAQKWIWATVGADIFAVCEYFPRVLGGGNSKKRTSTAEKVKFLLKRAWKAAQRVFVEYTAWHSLYSFWATLSHIKTRKQQGMR